jgi:acyl-CoA hydrolase
MEVDLEKELQEALAKVGRITRAIEAERATKPFRSVEASLTPEKDGKVTFSISVDAPSEYVYRFVQEVIEQVSKSVDALNKPEEAEKFRGLVIDALKRK